jgi:hypothetical protein
MAETLDGTLALLKTSFVADASKTLRRSTIRGEDSSCVPLLMLLAAMATHGEGQRQLLRCTGPPALLDVILELLEISKQPATVAEAVLLLRNLCFRADNKSYFLADPRCARVIGGHRVLAPTLTTWEILCSSTLYVLHCLPGAPRTKLSCYKAASMQQRLIGFPGKLWQAGCDVGGITSSLPQGGQLMCTRPLMAA